MSYQISNRTQNKNKNEQKLLKIILSNLMSLPAYKLQNKYREVFEKYAYAELNKSIKNIKLNENNITKNNNEQDKSSIDLYKKPNHLKILGFSFIFLPSIYKRTGWIAIASLILAFLVRASNPWLILIGVFSFLVFTYSFFIYVMQVGAYNSYIQGSFFIVDRILEDINNYIDSFGDIKEKNLHIRADIILENIIKDEISGLNYDLKKINIFNILFAFSLSIIFVYIMGDIPIKFIEWIADILNLGDFEYIKELNIEKFILFTLFPLGIALSKDIVISGLKERNKRLRRSLVIVKQRIEEQNYFPSHFEVIVSISESNKTEETQQTKEDVLNDFRQAWQEAMNGETIPVEKLWED